MSSKWGIAFVILWVVILVALAAYEVYALVDGKDLTPPLTHVTVRYAPWWITMPFLGWLFVHFLARYADVDYVNWLKKAGTVLKNSPLF